MNNKEYIYLTILFIILLISGCQNPQEKVEIILTEDLDTKTEGQFVPSYWQYDSHRFTQFKEKNGGSFEYDCPYLRTMKGLYRSKNLALPLIYKACREPIDRFTAPVVIWLHGGPFTYASAENNTAQSMFLKNGFTIVEPLYRGSHERPWNFFKPLGKISSFLDTRNEIIELTNFYRRTNRKVIFAGDSFGGLIISSILLTFNNNDSIVLFQPALSSKIVINQVRSNQKIINKNEETAFKLFCNKTEYKGCGDASKWLVKNILQTYWDFSVIENYKNINSSSSIYIISGEEDTVAEGSEAKTFAAAFPNSIHHLIVSHLGHEDIHNMQQFDQIEEFLAPVFTLSKMKGNER
jgi:hypothetical protein